MKILHLADTHIMSLSRHDEYKEIFEKIYTIAINEKVDYIVHCGDIVHSKTQISPELVDMVTDFLDKLSGIAPTVVILGNHDGNLKNSDRQDAISPIIKALGKDNLYLMKEYGEVIDTNNKVVFSGLSIFDDKNWKKPSKPDYINIALFHGPIAGVTTDTGYVLEHNECSLDTFTDYDYVFLGDIHKTNQIVDTEGKVRYPGSTIQQNFGETDDKGFLIWDIKSKDKFTCKHYSIDNPNPFITIILDNEGNLPETAIKDNSRVRIVADHSISLEKIKKAVEIIKINNKPKSVTFLNKATSSASTQEIIDETSDNMENLRDLTVQEALIRDYLKDFKTEDDVIDKVVELNKKFSSELNEEDDIFRGVHWKLKSLEWNNLFNYGDGNKIDFQKLNGIVGIFGKNYSGKSSVVDSLLYTIYNSTSKNNRKNLNVINQNKAAGTGKVEIEIGGETYNISRKSDKYTKKLKGVTSIEAKTDVEFTSNGDSLNGLARNDTDKEIRKYFGTIDDFFLTSMASQFGYLSFISEGSSVRKSILGKFLDLEIFEKKHKLAKEESASLKALLKKLEANNIDNDMFLANVELKSYENELKITKDDIENLKRDAKNAAENLNLIKTELNSVPVKVINYSDIKSKLEILKNSLDNLNSSKKTKEDENIKYDEILLKIDKFLSLINIGELNSQKQELDELNKEITKLEKEICSKEAIIKNHSVKLKLLEGIPCGNQFKECKFIKDAFQSKAEVGELSEQHKLLVDSLSGLNERYDVLDENFTGTCNKQAEASRKKQEIELKKAKNLASLQEDGLKILKTHNLIKELEDNIKIYEENKEAIENYAEKTKKKQDLEIKLSNINKNLDVRESQVVDLYKKIGSNTQKIENYEKQKEELQTTRKTYAAYDLYQSCMHTNGISYQIIKKKLPIINEEIEKILSNVVDFSVYLVNDDDKLDIMIKHAGCDERPLEMGSGAEKTLASTAIRLALLNVTTLPKSDIFVMDEPGTALDAENLDGFIKILEMIKNNFKTVILISHLDSLKECVDTQIVIDKKDGYAYINM